jgi:alpha,alpha-trehalase
MPDFGELAHAGCIIDEVTLGYGCAINPQRPHKFAAVIVRSVLSETLTAATAAPLAFGIASPEQAHAVAEKIRKRLLGPGGLDTTVAETGQQWDRPNGWAPLQYLAIEGLKAYGEPDLAHEIARRWIATNVGSYADLGVLAEKYDVARSPDAGAYVGRGGEYALQVGFGWTNGVLTALMAEYPDLAAEASRKNP